MPDEHAAGGAGYLDQVLAEGVPGAIGLIEDADGTVCLAAGTMTVDGPPMPTDAIVRVQSMTKAVTAVATLRLVEAGRLGLDGPVSRWLPELGSVRVLRTRESEADDTVPPARLASLPLAHQPGEGWRYHHGFMVLGILLGRLTGSPLGRHLAEDVFGPLGMVDTGFWATDPARLPAAYRLDDGVPVETEPAGAGHYAGDPGFRVDHGELVSTASDYLRFARMLRDRGLVDGRRYLGEESVAALTRDQVPEVAKTDESFGPHFWSGSGRTLGNRRLTCDDGA